MWRHVVVAFCTVVVFAGCGSRDLDLKVFFDRAQGLIKDAPVLYDQNRIGRVTEVRYEDSGSFVAHIRIREDFKPAVTEHSRFCIIADPGDKNRKAVEMIRVADGGEPLEDGARVTGSSKYSLLLEQTWKSIENGLDGFEAQLDELSEQLKGVPKSKAYNDLKKELEELAEEMEKAGKEGREKWEKEILPQLRDELEKLKEKWFKLQKEQPPEKQLEV